MYVTQTQIETTIPAQHLNDALDDNRDGMADTGLLDAVIAKASQTVDSMLEGLFEVPFTDPAPKAVAEAAFIFTCELIYDRRQIVEKNPFRDRADFWRERLEKIGNGDLPLSADTDKEFVPGAAVTEDVDVDGTMR